MPVKALPISIAYDWTGFYLGGHIGYAWGNSNWTASTTAAATPSVSGSLNLFQPFDAFNEAGSFFEGLQVGYDYMLSNRFVIGAEADASFPLNRAADIVRRAGGQDRLALPTRRVVPHAV
jgi:high affinity Mn2+ porin